jgi:hypothetical protein
MDEVALDLEQNPPLNPDYQRVVDFYSNKFQYVKLKFEGSNLPHKKIELPPNSLPINDTDLKKRLETKLNLFEKSSIKVIFSPLTNLKQKIDGVREEYLTKVKSREESLLNKRFKTEFDEAIMALEKEIQHVQEQLLQGVKNLIQQTKDKIKKELIKFFKENSTTLFSDNFNFIRNDKDYLEAMAKEKAEEICFRIRWPQAHILLSEFKLQVQYSEITFEDLKNGDFIAELVASGLISEEDVNQLAVFSKGIETK